MAKKEHQVPTLEMVEPEKLEFDADNPRFGGEGAQKSQDQIEKMLFDAPHYASELVDSLVENGFIDYEPLVARKSGAKYIVIEGNRRLAAVRHLRANLAKYPERKEDLEQIPVLVFSAQDDQKKKDIRAYLGVRHLMGIREWPPLSKAQFLDRESKSVSLDIVLKEVRLTKTQARRFLVPYRLLGKANVPLPEGEDFWMLAEALNRSGVKWFLELDVASDTLEVKSYNKKAFAKVLDDLYGPKAPESAKRSVEKRKVADTRQLSIYSKVLESDKARAVLHSGKDLSEAAIYVDTKDESIARLKKLLSEIRVLINKIYPSTSKDKTALKEALVALDDAVASITHE